jgi:hypothetical protein
MRLQGQGLDAGAETIRAMLVAGTSMSAPANWTIPAVSTIWRILTRRAVRTGSCLPFGPHTGGRLG